MGRHAMRLVGPNGRGVYVGIDVVLKCVERCRGKFERLEEEFRFEHTGGLLVPLHNGSTSFVFSWDSLVHADREVMQAYLKEIARVLRPGGRVFIHHSNLAACIPPGMMPTPGVFPTHARDEGVSAAWVREKAEDAGGLRVVSQECVDWGATGYLIDCFTVLERSDDRPYPPPSLAENYCFMEEAHAARRIVELYGKL
jgi:SAM-dependent methyltransferase